jgi:hypothetical protein
LSDPRPGPITFQVNHLACAFTTSSAAETSLFPFFIRSAIGWLSARPSSIGALLLWTWFAHIPVTVARSKTTHAQGVCSVPFPIDLARQFPALHRPPVNGLDQLFCDSFISLRRRVLDRF